jgi:ribonuclease HI
VKITPTLLALGLYEGRLNEAQCALLGVSYASTHEHIEALVGKEMKIGEVNLFLLLRGAWSQEIQEQIIANYKAVANFHNSMPKDHATTPKKRSKESLRIYCDGACYGNPGRAGSGLAIYRGEDLPALLYGGYQSQGTNNTAELEALYKALTIVKEEGEQRSIIYSDSSYSIDCITKWAYGWKKSGWKKKGGAIKNLAIIQEAHALYEVLKVRLEIKHVKGHAGVEGNELADRMARYAITQKEQGYAIYAYDDIGAVLALDEG